MNKTYINKSSFRQNGEQGVDMTLGGEVESSWRKSYSEIYFLNIKNGKVIRNQISVIFGIYTKHNFVE